MSQEDQTKYTYEPNGQRRAITCEHGVSLEAWCRGCCSHEPPFTDKDYGW